MPRRRYLISGLVMFLFWVLPMGWAEEPAGKSVLPDDPPAYLQKLMNEALEVAKTNNLLDRQKVLVEIIKQRLAELEALLEKEDTPAYLEALLIKAYQEILKEIEEGIKESRGRKLDIKDILEAKKELADKMKQLLEEMKKKGIKPVTPIIPKSSKDTLPDDPAYVEKIMKEFLELIGLKQDTFEARLKKLEEMAGERINEIKKLMDAKKGQGDKLGDLIKLLTETYKQMMEEILKDLKDDLEVLKKWKKISQPSGCGCCGGGQGSLKPPGGSLPLPPMPGIMPPPPELGYCPFPIPWAEPLQGKHCLFTVVQVIEMETRIHIKILEKLLEKYKSADEGIKAALLKALEEIKAINQQAKELAKGVESSL